MCEQCHQLMNIVTRALEESSAANRALLAFQKARIPKYLTQARQYIASGATSLTMSFHTQAQSLIRVTMILIVVGSAGTLTIGERQIPVNGLTTLYLGEEGMLLPAETQITLTQTTAGAMGLEFFGEEMVDRGERW